MGSIFFERMPDIKANYSGQSTILKDVNAFDREGVSGICSPLSNLFAQARMQGGMPSFLTESSSEAVFSEALQLLKRQIKTNDGMHIAFRDREYDVHKIQKEYRKDTPEDKSILLLRNVSFNNLFKDHNLVTYPTGKNGFDRHQVYFGRDSGEKCTLFDADKKGGEIQGSCADLIQRINKVSTERLRDDGINEIVIAASNGEKKEKADSPSLLSYFKFWS